MASKNKSAKGLREPLIMVGLFLLVIYLTFVFAYDAGGVKACENTGMVLLNNRTCYQTPEEITKNNTELNDWLIKASRGWNE